MFFYKSIQRFKGYTCISFPFDSMWSNRLMKPIRTTIVELRGVRVNSRIARVYMQTDLVNLNPIWIIWSGGGADE